MLNIDTLLSGSFLKDVEAFFQICFYTYTEEIIVVFLFYTPQSHQ